LAEAGLSLGHPDIGRQVARYLGFDPTNWASNAVHSSIVDDIIQSGLRQFYRPPPLPGEKRAHNWWFLQPKTTLATVANDYDYDLPDDFAYIVTDFTYSTSYVGNGLIRKVGEQHIRKLREGNTLVGKPQYFAIRPKTTAGTTGQRFEVLFYPAPDAVYTLEYRYAILLGKITAAAPYPYGGEMHGETILQSCLAIAEERQNDGVSGDMHRKKFFERLAASIALDQNQQPDFHGYNGDGSLGGRSPRLRNRDGIEVTLNGASVW